MVETITPVVYGGRRGRWLIGVALLVLGSTMAAVVFGAALGAVGAAFGAPWGVPGAIAVGVVGSLYVLRELAGLRIPVLQAKRQVPEWWRTFFSPDTAAFLYGVGLGIGFFTYLTYGTFVVVSAVAIAAGSPVLGVAIVAPFGFARGMTVLFARRAGSEVAAGELVMRLAEWGRRGIVRVANGVAILAMAVVAGVVAVAASPTTQAQVGVFAAAMVALLFAWAAGVKLLDMRRWRDSLAGYGLGANLQHVVALVVPALEASVAILVLAGRAAIACALAFAMLVAFSGAILRAVKLRGPKIDCGCFGGRARLDYRVLMLRNLVVATAALTGALLAPTAVPTAHLGPPNPLPVALMAVGLAVGAWATRATSRALRGGRT